MDNEVHGGVHGVKQAGTHKARGRLSYWWPLPPFQTV